MKLSFRWYGADDPISLEYIRQIPGMRSIVSAVYDVAPDVYKRQAQRWPAIPIGAKPPVPVACVIDLRPAGLDHRKAQPHNLGVKRSGAGQVFYG